MNGDGHTQRSSDDSGAGCVFSLMFVMSTAALVMSIIALVLAGC